MPRARPGHLNDYRAVLAGKGDIAIGARARAERRRRILIAIAGLGLIGGALGAHVLLRPREPANAQRGTPVLVRCVDPNCGYEGVVPVQQGQARYPVMCPRCGQHSCQKVWECRDCGHRFVPVGAPDELQCPECGSRRVGTALTPAAIKPPK
jgi:DNA-directed RNA polymerase subunit RPC12/RpoP